MPASRLTCLALGGLMFLLQACASIQDADPSVAEASEEPKRGPVPELTLNLPDDSQTSCDCTPQDSVDRTFLEKGFSYLAEGDYREAVVYFRRYQRLESAPGVDWEANIAVAYVKMLPQTPYYNWRASRESYLRLMREVPKGVQLHEQILLMREMLELLVNLHVQINDLQSENATVTENLQKREEALRRLRELMLGQKAEIQ